MTNFMINMQNIHIFHYNFYIFCNFKLYNLLLFYYIIRYVKFQMQKIEYSLKYPIFWFYNNIGLICSPSKAYSIVFIIYSKSNTMDLGFVIGLSCLNGTK